MTKNHGRAVAAASRLIDQGTRDSCCRTNGHSGRAHHRMVQLAHGQRAYQQIDRAGLDGLATRGQVIRWWSNKGDLGRMLATDRLTKILDQTHFQRTLGTNALEHGQGLGVAVNGILQLGAGIANSGCTDKDGRDARID